MEGSYNWKIEDEPPFDYLGPTIDFNSIDIKQSNIHIIISCENYTNQMLQAHEWDTTPSSPFQWLSKTHSPLPEEKIHQVFKKWS